MSAAATLGARLQRAKVVVFDFDGVLAESVEVKTEAFASLYRSYGPEIEAAVVAHHRANGGMSRFDKIRFYHREFLSETLNDAGLETLCAEFARRVLDGVITSPWVHGARALLESLEDGPRLVIASATPEPELEVIIKARNMGHWFSTVRGAPTTKATILRDCLAQNGGSLETMVFIGDAPNDQNAATTVGVPFIGRLAPGLPNLFAPGTLIVPDLAPEGVPAAIS